MKDLQTRINKIYDSKPFWGFIYSPNKIYNYRLSSKNKFINKYKHAKGFKSIDSLFFTKNLKVIIFALIISAVYLVFITSNDFNNLNTIYGGIGILSFCLFALNLISVSFVLHKIPKK